MRVNIKHHEHELFDAVEVQHDPQDFWSLDVTLSKVIHPMLVEFRRRNLEEKYSGYPGNLSSQEEWLNILEHMVYTFGQIANEYPEAPENRDEAKEYYESIEDGLHLFSKYFNYLWE